MSFDYVPGKDHPYSILADEIESLPNVDAEQLANYIARIDRTIFDRFFIK